MVWKEVLAPAIHIGSWLKDQWDVRKKEHRVAEREKAEDKRERENSYIIQIGQGNKGQIAQLIKTSGVVHPGKERLTFEIKFDNYSIFDLEIEILSYSVSLDEGGGATYTCIPEEYGPRRTFPLPRQSAGNSLFTKVTNIPPTVDERIVKHAKEFPGSELLFTVSLKCKVSSEKHGISQQEFLCSPIIPVSTNYIRTLHGVA